MKLASINPPLMPKRYFCTSISFRVFKKQMLQAASTELLNLLFTKAHNSEYPNLSFPIQIKPVKSVKSIVC